MAHTPARLIFDQLMHGEEIDHSVDVAHRLELSCAAVELFISGIGGLREFVACVDITRIDSDFLLLGRFQQGERLVRRLPARLAELRAAPLTS